MAVWSIETVADGMFTLFICRAMFVLSTEPAGTYIVYRAILLMCDKEVIEVIEV